jgi:hypothetical protein
MLDDFIGCSSRKLHKSIEKGSPRFPQVKSPDLIQKWSKYPKHICKPPYILNPKPKQLSQSRTVTSQAHHQPPKSPSNELPSRSAPESPPITIHPHQPTPNPLNSRRRSPPLPHPLPHTLAPLRPQIPPLKTVPAPYTRQTSNSAPNTKRGANTCQMQARGCECAWCVGFRC